MDATEKAFNSSGLLRTLEVRFPGIQPTALEAVAFIAFYKGWDARDTEKAMIQRERPNYTILNQQGETTEALIHDLDRLWAAVEEIRSCLGSFWCDFEKQKAKPLALDALKTIPGKGDVAHGKT